MADKPLFGTGSSLPDNQTYLVPYDKLSASKKAKMAAEAQAQLKDAEDNESRPISARLGDAYYALNPFIPAKDKKAQSDAAAEDIGNRKNRVIRAKERIANPAGGRDGLIGDDVPHEIDPNAKLFKKGGLVRGDGKAQRGRTKGRHC